MTVVGDLRSSGIITMYNPRKEYKADYQGLCHLANEIRRNAVYHSPAVIQDDEGNAVGSIFPHILFPEVKRLICFINREECQIRSDDFALVMSEGQKAAEILKLVKEPMPTGQTTLEAVLS